MRALFPLLVLSSMAAAAPRYLPTPYAAPAEVGQELLGTRPPEWQVSHWLNSEPLSLRELRGKVVLIRWWMAPACPFCAASAEALNELATKYRNQGLAVLGFYHHKADSPLTASHVKAQAERLGFRFPVAIDDDWRTLRRWWLDKDDRGWTSVTFLLGRDGKIRHIHGGGAYWPGEPGYAALEEAVRKALAERDQTTSGG